MDDHPIVCVLALCVCVCASVCACVCGSRFTEDNRVYLSMRTLLATSYFMCTSKHIPVYVFHAILLVRV